MRSVTTAVTTLPRGVVVGVGKVHLRSPVSDRSPGLGGARLTEIRTAQEEACVV